MGFKRTALFRGVWIRKSRVRRCFTCTRSMVPTLGSRFRWMTIPLSHLLKKWALPLMSYSLGGLPAQLLSCQKEPFGYYCNGKAWRQGQGSEELSPAVDVPRTRHGNDVAGRSAWPSRASNSRTRSRSCHTRRWIVSGRQQPFLRSCIEIELLLTRTYWVCGRWWSSSLYGSITSPWMPCLRTAAFAALRIHSILGSESFSHLGRKLAISWQDMTAKFSLIRRLFPRSKSTRGIDMHLMR